MKRICALVLAALLSLGLVACAGSDPVESATPSSDAPGGPGTALRRVVQSADTLEDVGTARFAASVGVIDDDRSLDVTTEGSIDFQHDALSTTAAFGGSFGDGEIDGTMETRLVDGVTYTRATGLPDVPGLDMPDGKQWLAFDVGSAAADVLDWFGAPRAEPLDDLRALAGASEVEEVGTETVRGVETTHYRATGERGSMEVWLDSEDRVRRFSTDGEDLTLTYELFAFGEPVEITAPRADEVASLGDVVGDAVDGFVDELTGA
jgi:hypothetical protein